MKREKEGKRRRDRSKEARKKHQHTFSSFKAILTSTHPSQPLPRVLLYFLLMAAPSIEAMVGWGSTDSAVQME